MSDLWALNNTLKGWTLYDLSTREVQLLVHVMSANEVRLSKVCRKSDAKWMNLSQNEFPDFFKKDEGAAEQYPATSGERSGTQTGTHVDTDYFLVKKRHETPRLHRRVDYATPCTILSTKKNFDTETVNVSEGGIQVKDLLPDWIAGYFIVSIHSPQGLIQLMCSLVEDQKEKCRIQIVSEDSDPQYLIFKNWIATLK